MTELGQTGIQHRPEPDFTAWIGREETRKADIVATPVAAMAATLNLEKMPAQGEPLPAGWQWLFFNPATRRGELGPDGHPAKGGFLPPIPAPRRMWAGSRIRYPGDLIIGAHAERRSRILKVQNKTGKSGTLWFVTVEHAISSNGIACIIEEQDLVYREPPPPGAKPVKPERYNVQAQWSQTFMPDTTLLFRYSALTFNGHRIHYDYVYAREVEGYPNLVVHGPLAATLLQQFACEHSRGRSLSRFDFRGVTPLLVDRAFLLEGKEEVDGSLSLWARGPDSELAMSATAHFR